MRLEVWWEPNSRLGLSRMQEALINRPFLRRWSMSACVDMGSWSMHHLTISKSIDWETGKLKR